MVQAGLVWKLEVLKEERKALLRALELGPSEETLQQRVNDRTARVESLERELEKAQVKVDKRTRMAQVAATLQEAEKLLVKYREELGLPTSTSQPAPTRLETFDFPEFPEFHASSNFPNRVPLSMSCDPSLLRPVWEGALETVLKVYPALYFGIDHTVVPETYVYALLDGEVSRRYVFRWRGKLYPDLNSFQRETRA